jgi:hypothetical protein
MSQATPRNKAIFSPISSLNDNLLNNQAGAFAMYNKSMIALSIAVVIGSASATLASDHEDQSGGFVMPCSLDGVNPVYHPRIFGNPAIATSYGFVEGRDHSWQCETTVRVGRAGTERLP